MGASYTYLPQFTPDVLAVNAVGRERGAPSVSSDKADPECAGAGC
jgi:hypothetical protein